MELTIRAETDNGIMYNLPIFVKVGKIVNLPPSFETDIQKTLLVDKNSAKMLLPKINDD
jgi:hypothetical protein